MSARVTAPVNPAEISPVRWARSRCCGLTAFGSKSESPALNFPVVSIVASTVIIAAAGPAPGEAFPGHKGRLWSFRAPLRPKTPLNEGRSPTCNRLTGPGP